MVIAAIMFFVALVVYICCVDKYQGEVKVVSEKLQNYQLGGRVWQNL